MWFVWEGKKNSSQRNDHILAGNQRSGPVKVSVVGGGQGGSKIWRRERIEMTDPDLDDVAFLSGVYWHDFLGWQIKWVHIWNDRPTEKININEIMYTRIELIDFCSQ